jgi:hypothetical protein
MVSVSVTGTATGSVSGVLALFDFQVAGTVPAGSSLAVDLSAAGLDGGGLVSRPDADGAGTGAAVPPAPSTPPLVSMSLIAATGDATAATSPTRVAQARLLGDEAA